MDFNEANLVSEFLFTDDWRDDLKLPVAAKQLTPSHWKMVRLKDLYSIPGIPSNQFKKSIGRFASRLDLGAVENLSSNSR